MSRLDLPPFLELPWMPGTNHLLRIFSETTNSYKFFWFWGILECTAYPESYEIPFAQIAIEMVKKAWYPHHYFHLNFGAQDQLAKHIDTIRAAENLEEDILVAALDAALKSPQRKPVPDQCIGIRIGSLKLVRQNLT